jgi:hypothetical protein
MKRIALLLAVLLCLSGTWTLTVGAEQTGGLSVLPIGPVVPVGGVSRVDENVTYGALEGSDARYTSYRYVVNVEFGSMSFYYDWGRWDENALTYVSDSTSSSPAYATSNNAPGWYGFDGAANRIGFNYRRIGNEAGTEYLKISMHFNFSTDGAGYPIFAQDHMAFSLYDTADFNGLVSRMDAYNSYAASLVIAPSVDDYSTPGIDEAELMQDYYLSLEGAPLRTDLSPYKNGTPTSLGLLTIRIDFTSQP